jgi:preprotein translocase subunit SecG
MNDGKMMNTSGIANETNQRATTASSHSVDSSCIGSVGVENTMKKQCSGDTSITGSGNRSKDDTGTGSSGHDENDRDFIRQELANQKETRYVDFLRYLVITILVCSAAAISTVTFVLIQRSEQDAMVAQYYGASSKVLESFDAIVHKIGLMNTVGIAATSYGYLAADDNVANVSSSSSISSSSLKKWPFITVPNFQQTASTARLLSGSLFTSFAPLVKHNYRTEWEEFVVQPVNSFWM